MSGAQENRAGNRFRAGQRSGSRRVSDFEVLQRAAAKNRVLVSHDRRTMPSAFYAFIRERTSPGLILLKQGCPIGLPIEELRVCYSVLDPSDFENRIIYLPL